MNRKELLERNQHLRTLLWNNGCGFAFCNPDVNHDNVPTEQLKNETETLEGMADVFGIHTGLNNKDKSCE